MPKTAAVESPIQASEVIAPVRSTPAPYLPFLTFLSAITALEQGIPKQLDRTIWPSQSGLIQSQILMAFRFLGLVDDQDRPTDLLHDLVTDKDKRAHMVGHMVMNSYAHLIAHDLTKMTPKMVENEMERYNVTGDTKRKAVTFFLRAVKFAGLPMHPLLSSTVRNSGPRGKRKAKKGVFIGDMSGRTEISYPSGSAANIKIVRLSNGGTVSLSISADPFTLPSEDRQFVFDLVDKLQAYAQAHPVNDGGEHGEEEEEGEG